jgi:DNA-binding transcriptional LysR family regulator
LVAAVAATAPSVRLEIRPTGTSVPAIIDRLDRGDLDLTLGLLSGTENPGERFCSALLLEDPFVMVMRRGHPASRRKLSAAAFAALPHLEISSSREGPDFIDHWLAEHKLVRHIALRAPYLSAPPILAQSDMVATLSRRVAQEVVRNHPLQIVVPPYESPFVRTVMVWHRRLDRHPAHRWLRDLILSLTKNL